MQTTLITGATDGIGKALACEMLRNGWHVFIVGRNPQKLQTTLAELKTETGKTAIDGVAADLSLMDDARKACDAFLAKHSRLDALVLNANAIANQRIITPEGNEQNFALGYLSRVQTIACLQEVLETTENAQILSVIGRSLSRLDFDDLTIEKDFTGWKGLTRWQWAISVFLKNYAEKHPVLTNTYMPGLVKTKILANEPQPMRTVVKIMNKLIGITPEKSAENIFSVINQISAQHTSGHYFEWKKDKGFPKIAIQPGDTERLLETTQKLLR